MLRVSEGTAGGRHESPLLRHESDAGRLTIGERFTFPTEGQVCVFWGFMRGGQGIYCVGFRSDHIWVTIEISLCRVHPIHSLINQEPSALQGLIETHTHTRTSQRRE